MNAPCFEFPNQDVRRVCQGSEKGACPECMGPMNELRDGRELSFNRYTGRNRMRDRGGKRVCGVIYQKWSVLTLIFVSQL